MTREEFARFAADDFNMPIKKCREAVDIFTEGICRAVEEGHEEIQFMGFGTFAVKKRGARVGRNIQTGQMFDVPPKHAIYFHPGKYLRDAVDDTHNAQKKETKHE